MEGAPVQVQEYSLYDPSYTIKSDPANNMIIPNGDSSNNSNSYVNYVPTMHQYPAMQQTLPPMNTFNMPDCGYNTNAIMHNYWYSNQQEPAKVYQNGVSVQAQVVCAPYTTYLQSQYPNNGNLVYQPSSFDSQVLPFKEGTWTYPLNDTPLLEDEKALAVLQNLGDGSIPILNPVRYLSADNSVYNSESDTKVYQNNQNVYRSESGSPNSVYLSGNVTPQNGSPNTVYFSGNVTPQGTPEETYTTTTILQNVPGLSHGMDLMINDVITSDLNLNIPSPVSSNGFVNMNEAQGIWSPVIQQQNLAEGIKADPKKKKGTRSTTNKKRTTKAKQSQINAEGGNAFYNFNVFQVPAKGSAQELLDFHSQKARIGCTECTLTFSKRCYMLQHFKSIHSGNAFKCPRCGKLFKTQEEVDIHEAKHTGEKKFKCHKPDCNNSYVHKTDLTKHLNLHDNLGKACSECSKVFVRLDQFLNHLKTHTKNYNKKRKNTDEIERPSKVRKT